jgi:hypothetical protein
MTKLFLGFAKEVELPRGGCLIIDDEVRDIPRSRIFDALRHGFNPIKNINYRSACDFVDIIDVLFSRGDTTLTKGTGLEFIQDALEAAPKTLEDLIERPDKKSTTGHTWAHGKIRRILRSHVLTRAFCNPCNFSFRPGSVIQARINRKEIGEFDALTIGLFLMAHYRGPHIVIPDFGFYGRDFHTSLIREQRIVIGCNTLSELPPKIRQAALLFDEKIASHARLEDAELLAEYSGLIRGTNAYNDYVSEAVN